jgi:hypothetical protein
MESVVAVSLLDFALSNNLFSSTQFGFLPRRSCDLQLLEFVDWIVSVVNASDCVDVVYLDLKKAFDRVPRKRLLEKLRAHGIAGDLLLWLQSFLTGRKQRVTVNGAYSRELPVLSGVPQGSVLGPVLFLFYINDLDEHCSSAIRKYADDSKVMRRLRMSYDLCTSLDIADMQADLDSLMSWCDIWQMEFNVSKCACLHFGYKNPQAVYHLNGNEIPVRDCERDLGVIISSNMKFSTHCATIAKSAERVLWCIRRAFQYISKDVFLRLYKSLIRPRLEYASSVWCPHYLRDIEIIERVQRRATKLFRPVKDLPYESRLRELGLQTLKTRRFRCDLIFVYKLCHDLVDLPLERFFDWPTDHRLRGHSLKLRARMTPKLDPVRFSFAYRVVDVWNSLPESVVTAPSLAVFKKGLHDSGVLPEL